MIRESSFSCSINSSDILKFENAVQSCSGPLETVMQQITNIHEEFLLKNNYLHCAALIGNLPLFRFFLLFNVTFQENEEGKTPLDCFDFNKVDQTKIKETLLLVFQKIHSTVFQYHNTQEKSLYESAKERGQHALIEVLESVSRDEIRRFFDFGPDSLTLPPVGNFEFVEALQLCSSPVELVASRVLSRKIDLKKEFLFKHNYLHFAAINSNLELFRFFLCFQARFQENEAGETPFDYFNFTQIKVHQNISIAEVVGTVSLVFQKTNLNLFQYRNTSRRTLYEIALRKKDSELIEALEAISQQKIIQLFNLTQNALPSVGNFEFIEALTLCARPLEDVKREFFENKLDFQKKILFDNSYLHCAAWNNNLPVFQFLMLSGVPFQRNIEQKTPLDYLNFTLLKARHNIGIADVLETLSLVFQRIGSNIFQYQIIYKSANERQDLFLIEALEWMIKNNN